MQVHRIAKAAYIEDLTGIGAKSVGGRWNFKGVSVLYTSSSIALSMLECMAHFPIAYAPKDMAMAVIDIPDHSITEIHRKDLPNNWREVPSPRELKQLSYDWVKKQETLVLKVPSIIVPQEFNYIVNPFHKDFKMVKMKKIVPFTFDNRVL